MANGDDFLRFLFYGIDWQRAITVMHGGTVFAELTLNGNTLVMAFAASLIFDRAECARVRDCAPRSLICFSFAGFAVCTQMMCNIFKYTKHIIISASSEIAAEKMNR